MLDSIIQSFAPSWYFRGKEKFKDLATIKIIFRTIAFISVLFLVKIPSDSWKYLLIHAISSFGISLVQLFIMTRDIGMVKFQKWHEVQNILKSSTYNFFIIVLPTIFNNISIFLLSYLVGPFQLGYYYAVVKIHRGFNTLYTPLFDSFFPYLIKTFNYNKEKALEISKKFNIILFILGSFLCIIIWLFSESIISLLLGDEYLPAANYLKSFALLLPLTVNSYIWGNQWMIAMKQERQFSMISILSNLIAISFLIVSLSELKIFAIPLVWCKNLSHHQSPITIVNINFKHKKVWIPTTGSILYFKSLKF